MLPNDSLQSGQDSALRILAREMQTSHDEVLRIYESEVAALETGARIRTFIPALALRRARARLHGRRHP